VTYRIQGLSADRFRPLFGCSDAELAAQGVTRVQADSKPGYPCRITLEDAEAGEDLLLLSHEHQPAQTPYRSAYAIYVRERATEAADFVDTLPPVFAGRTVALRGFDLGGMLQAALLAEAADVEPGINTLLGRADVAYIHAHGAAYGCFLARIDRT
jgi:hypothetical protein